MDTERTVDELVNEHVRNVQNKRRLQTEFERGRREGERRKTIGRIVKSAIKNLVSGDFVLHPDGRVGFVIEILGDRIVMDKIEDDDVNREEIADLIQSIVSGLRDHLYERDAIKYDRDPSIYYREDTNLQSIDFTMCCLPCVAVSNIWQCFGNERLFDSEAPYMHKFTFKFDIAR